MRSRFARPLIVLSLLAAFAAVLATGGVRRTEAITTAEYCVEPEEVAFLNIINDYRVQNGLNRLVMTQTLGAAAEHHSADMATNNYFSHTLFNGETWSQNMTDHGYTYNTYRGENIAGGYETAQQVFDAWKASPGHNANMLNSNYFAIGIGRVRDSDGQSFPWLWTTDFGGYVDAPAVLCQSPTQAPPTATTAPTKPATATTAPTKTPVPPTATAVPPTATTVPPTKTPVPPTATATRPAPTATTPPTVIPAPPTATAPAPTATEPAPTIVPRPTRPPRPTYPARPTYPPYR